MTPPHTEPSEDETLVLNALHTAKKATAKAIADQTGLSPGTVSEILARLEKCNLAFYISRDELKTWLPVPQEDAPARA